MFLIAQLAVDVCCLYLEDKNEPLIFEVTGEHPKFERNVVKARPENSRSFLQKIYIGLIRNADVEIVKQTAETVPMDNETVEWDCQDYVLEILDNLEDEFILDHDDEDYCDVREILKEKRGAIL